MRLAEIKRSWVRILARTKNTFFSILLVFFVQNVLNVWYFVPVHESYALVAKIFFKIPIHTQVRILAQQRNFETHLFRKQ